MTMPIYPKRRFRRRGSSTPVQVPCIPGPIRPYGSGKFNTILNSVIYAVSPFDEEIGNVDESGWYGRINLKDENESKDFLTTLHETAVEMGGGTAPLTDEECQEIMKTRVIIVSENSQGFVDMDYYENVRPAERDWKSITDLYEEPEEEPGEDA